MRRALDPNGQAGRRAEVSPQLYVAEDMIGKIILMTNIQY